MTARNSLPWMVAATLAVAIGPVATAQQPQRLQQAQQPQPAREPVTVSFSDPSRPGTLRMNLINGSVTVRGANRKDVVIDARPQGGRDTSRRREPSDPAAAKGLRRLTPVAGGFTVDQEANAISINTSPFGRVDYEIQVPSRTNLRLMSANNEILVEGVEGEIEVSSANGPVTLRNVTGSVVANSHNGKLIAVMSRVAAEKAMAFTSFNGDVDVTLPSSIKANLKLRSDEGDVFTDFDVEIKPAPPGAPAGRRSATAVGRRSQAVPTPPSPPTPPTPPTPAGAPRDRGRDRIDVNPSIYGSVNGGGVEFEIRTFHGNVYVRKGP